MNTFRLLLKDQHSISLSSTLILGFRAEMDQNLITAYSRTGIIHVLSVSGMHVGLIYWLLEFVLQRMGASRKGRNSRFALISILIWLYVLVTGYASSVIRAALMLSLLMISRMIQRPSSYPNLIYLAAFGMLHYQPGWLWDIGFQLSFLAIAGIIYLYPLLLPLLRFPSLASRKFWELICISIAAQCFTSPLSMYYFHLFPLTFIISNLFIIIPVTLIMYSGILVLIFKFQWLTALLQWLISLLNKGIMEINNLPYPVLDKLWLDPLQVIILYGILCIPLLPVRLKNKLYYVCFLLLIYQAKLCDQELSRIRQRHLIRFKLPGQEITAIIRGDEAFLFTSVIPQQSRFMYYIQPALDSMGIHKLSYVHPQSSFSNPYIQLKKGQLRFGKQKIRIWEQQ